MQRTRAFVILALAAVVPVRAQVPSTLARGSLHIHVLGELSLPLPLAKVRVAWPDGEVLRTTDGSGVVLLSGMPLVPLTVDVSASGFAAHHALVRLQASMPNAWISLQLDAAAELSGHVTHRGKPVPGARVIILPSGSFRRQVEVRTDVKGVYRAQAQLGDNRVMVIAPGLTLGAKLCRVQQTTQFDVALEAAAGRTLSFRIVGATKEQLATARCRASFELPDHPGLPLDLLTGSPDEQGEWTVRNVPRELRYRNGDVELPGAAAFCQEEANDGGDALVRTFVVRARESVAGTIVAADGKALSGIKVWCRPDAGGETLAITNDLGKFELPAAMASGEYGFLDLGDPGYAWQNAGTTFAQRLPLQFDPQQQLHCVVTRACQVRGTVIGADGRPAPYALVKLRDQQEEPGPFTFADAAGRFELGNIDASSSAAITLLARDPSGMHRTMPLQFPADGELELPPLQLHPGGVITGRVVDADGKPVIGAVVTAWPHAGSCISDQQGRFAFRQLEDGPRQLRVGFSAMRMNQPPAAVCEVVVDGKHEVELRCDR